MSNSCWYDSVIFWQVLLSEFICFFINQDDTNQIFKICIIRWIMQQVYRTTDLDWKTGQNPPHFVKKDKFVQFWIATIRQAKWRSIMPIFFPAHFSISLLYRGVRCLFSPRKNLLFISRRKIISDLHFLCALLLFGEYFYTDSFKINVHCKKEKNPKPKNTTKTKKKSFCGAHNTNLKLLISSCRPMQSSVRIYM